MITGLQPAGIIEPPDGMGGLRNHAALGGETRSLDREHKPIRHFAGPFAKALRLLRAVIGAVDLDRGQLGGGVGQFLGLRQFLGVKYPAPRLERPAADADIDVAAGGGGLRGFAHGRARLEGTGLEGTGLGETGWRSLIKSRGVDQFAPPRFPRAILSARFCDINLVLGEGIVALWIRSRLQVFWARWSQPSYWS